MEADLLALLLDTDDLTALVGDRIAWNVIAQGDADPNVSLFRIAGAPALTMDGPDKLTGATVQINVRALTATSLWAVRDAVTALNGFAGTIGNTEFLGVFFRSERQGTEKPDAALYHFCQLDFDVWSRATAAS